MANRFPIFVEGGLGPVLETELPPTIHQTYVETHQHVTVQIQPVIVQYLAPRTSKPKPTKNWTDKLKERDAILSQLQKPAKGLDQIAQTKARELVTDLYAAEYGRIMGRM